MDLVKIQTLIAQGKVITDITDIDPTQTFLQVGIYQPNNRKIKSGNADTYPSFVIPLSEIDILPGPQGPQGVQGPQGIQGVPGVSGTSGLETLTRYSSPFQATGMTFTGSGVTYPTYNSYYVKAGLLVSFVIEIDFTTVTNFGTGQYKVALPFAPAFGYNHFSGWIWADPNVDPDTGTGHTILNADTAGITTVLDLHYLKQSGGANSPIREGLWLQDLPVTLTTISKAYINGTYISAT